MTREKSRLARRGQAPGQHATGRQEAARTPQTADSKGQETKAGQPGNLGRNASGDYQNLPADLDGMHNDSWVPPVQAAGSRKAAARAAREAARKKGRQADELFARAPGFEGPAPNVPSTLNMDRHGSAAQTGRAVMKERQREHNETSPAVTAGDVDADWAKGYDAGDEAPGGDNPTPGQVVVEDVGKALGVEYEDTEELKGSDKIAERDRHRWELDPASSEDYDERAREESDRNRKK